MVTTGTMIDPICEKVEITFTFVLNRFDFKIKINIFLNIDSVLIF